MADPDRPASLSRPLLTPMRLNVLRLYANGHSTVEVAETLDRSVNTIKMQARIICRRLGARNITQAVAVALDRGLLPRGSVALTVLDPPRMPGPMPTPKETNRAHLQR